MTEHHPSEFPVQQQPSQPGLTEPMDPTPDHGETSWVGRDRLAGRRALITGGDSGIGRAVAIAYAREGADVAIVHLPEEADDAAETIAAVEAAGRRGVAFALDLREEQACIDAVRRTVDELGGLDVLVSNAAHQRQRDGIEDISWEGIDRVFKTNLYALLILAREAVPHLPEGGSIIVTSSVQSADPKPGLVDYAMTKSAQRAFVEAMAAELGPRGIRVNAVAPGPVWTPLIPATGFPDEKVAEFGQDTPFGRAGQPAEVAGAYVYLASDEATYTSAAVIGVTGGRAVP
ncbi:SDR family oxidoreductase [Agrococcus jejuensis]|uniref:SDR family oxidoreductase n=1 Tax=Agrococcus jejuensis TaxID=399736 RepID=UPI0021B66D85|nr:SDR family oxidoreductase [Agrococcus jejuensis]